jgi:hypothetical protein
MIRIPFVAKRKKRIREAPVRGLDNIGGGYMRSISIVQALEKTRQVAWGTLEVVICVNSKICQLAVVVERDDDQNKRRSTRT